MTLSVLIIIILFIVTYYFWKDRRQILLEGVIIGIISGICISYLTDADFQANVNGPLINLARVFNKNVRYISNAWTNIKIEKLKDDRYNVEATNTVSGNTVEFTNVHVTTIPASLRYQIITWDNEATPVGGSTVEFRKNLEK